MPLQLSKFTDLPLQFVILKLYHCNFTTLWNTPLLTPSDLVWQLLERIQGRAHPHVGGVDPRWPPDPLHAGVWIPNANLSIWMMVGWRGFGRLVCRDGWIRFGCANQWAESKYTSTLRAPWRTCVSFLIGSKQILGAFMSNKLLNL